MTFSVRSPREDPHYPEGPGPSHPYHAQSPFLGSAGELEILSSLSEEEEEEEHSREVSSWGRLPWWRRPSPYWLVFGTFFSSIGFSALLAPKVALYTALVCRVHRPEYTMHNHSLHSSTLPLAQDLMSFGTVDPPIPYIFGSETFTLPLGPTYTLYTLSSDHVSNEPDPDQKCASDPVVQAVVARLNAVFVASMGILSCLTAGWWGSLSDRYGRRLVLFISVFGLFATEFTHVITAWFVDALPGGYWFPLVGFSIEGLLGSKCMTSGVATAHAYVADTTGPSTRSRYFSLSLGLTFTGVAIGPALGGLLIRSTGTILSVFYFATILHGVYTVFLMLFLPESLTRARARGARLRRRQETASQASNRRTRNVLKYITGFLKPLVVLLPERDANPLNKSRDWNLFFLAIAYALVTSSLRALSYKFQYAAAQFNWTPEVTSYYVSILGATRAIFLAAILPLIIRCFKPIPIQLPATPNEPLRGTIGPRSRGASSHLGTAPTNAPEPPLSASRSHVFDLILARVSVGLETVAFLGMAVASTGTLFTLASTVNSLGAGFFPATQALALDIYTNRRSKDRGEVGKLFGALSVPQALITQIVGPALYGFVYSNTVARFPQAIMIVSMCTSLLALVFLSFVRIPSESRDHVTPEDSNEQSSEDIVPGILRTVTNNVVEGS